MNIYLLMMNESMEYSSKGKLAKTHHMEKPELGFISLICRFCLPLSCFYHVLDFIDYTVFLLMQNLNLIFLTQLPYFYS